MQVKACCQAVTSHLVIYAHIQCPIDAISASAFSLKIDEEFTILVVLIVIVWTKQMPSGIMSRLILIPGIQIITVLCIAQNAAGYGRLGLRFSYRMSPAVLTWDKIFSDLFNGLPTCKRYVGICRRHFFGACGKKIEAINAEVETKGYYPIHRPDVVTVLADVGEQVAEIDIARMEAAKARVEELRKECPPPDADEYLAIPAALRSYKIRLQAVRNYRRAPSTPPRSAEED